MKKLSLIFIMLIFSCTPQKEIIKKSGEENLTIINSENYYDYLISKPTSGIMVESNWIRRDEIVDILINELQDMGYIIKKNSLLFKLGNGDFVSINGFEPYKKFGFIVQEGHAADIKKSDRTESKPFKYMIYNTHGIPRLSYTSEIPDNIFIFKEDWYWFQECYGCKDTKTVKRVDAIRILKEDLKNYLNTYQEN